MYEHLVALDEELPKGRPINEYKSVTVLRVASTSSTSLAVPATSPSAPIKIKRKASSRLVRGKSRKDDKIIGSRVAAHSYVTFVVLIFIWNSQLPSVSYSGRSR